MTGNPQTVMEGTGPRFLFCVNPNSPEVSSGIQWFRASDGVSFGTSENLLFNAPIDRTMAGEYECGLISLLDSSTANSFVELTVECKLHCDPCVVILLLPCVV